VDSGKVYILIAKRNRSQRIKGGTGFLACALTVGVVVGTYSSIFVVSPIVYAWPTSQDIITTPDSNSDAILSFRWPLPGFGRKK
jgi:hypothetical protein